MSSPARGVCTIALCSVLLLAFATGVRAAESLPVVLRDLVDDAALIIRGRVTDVRGVAVQRAGIDSIATIEVERVIKGAADRFVSVRLSGGTVGRYRFVVVGAPTVRVNQTAIFFLMRTSDGAWRPVDLSAGVLRVQRGLLGPMVIPPVQPSDVNRPGPLVRGNSLRAPVTADEFESLVRAIVVAPRTPAGRPR